MRHSLRLILLCIPALLVACSDDVTPVQPPAPAPVWSEIGGFPPVLTLYALWVPQMDYAIGVGPHGTVMRWDGLQWAAIGNDGAQSLYAIAGATGGEMVAAGDSGEIVRFDGSRFTPVSSPTTADLRGLWTPGGNAFTAVGSGGVILRGDGTSWTLDASPVTDPLFAVWGSGPGDIFAVGLNGVILHFDGAAWTPMPSGTTSLLASVAGTGPDDVYAVGEAGTALHYDGTAWTPMPTGTLEILQGVSAGSSTMAVGSNGTVLELAGGAWEPAAALTHEWLYATAQIGAQAWIAGTRAVFVHEGDAWSPATRGAVPALTGITGPPHAPLRVAGEDGYIALHSGGSWRLEDSGDFRPFNAIWCSSDGIVYAAGRNRIMRHDGIEWTVEFSSPAELYDVNGGASVVFAVGATGAILRRSAGVWMPVRTTLPVFDNLHAVASVADDEAYIVGDDGRVIAFNGLAWSPAAARPTPNDLYDVAKGLVDDKYRVIAVGESGSILGLRAAPASGWETLASPTQATLRALARGPGDRLYAVGESGAVIAWDGSAWSVVPSPTLKPLRAAWSDGSSLFVAGGGQSGGPIVLRYGAP
jgi:hypothetical protein